MISIAASYSLTHAVPSFYLQHLSLQNLHYTPFMVQAFISLCLKTFLLQNQNPFLLNVY